MKKPEKILVHVCCAACASHVFSDLKKAGFEIVAFFFNPEVQGKTEYERRLADVEKLCLESEIKLVTPDYNPALFTDPLLPYRETNSIKYITDKNRYRRKRCELCIGLIVETTANQAKKLRIKNFTSSTLCSPYKDHNQIWDQGVQSAENSEIIFFYKDFRKGYWMGRNFARSRGMAIPAYCGCSESLSEGRLE